MSLLCRYAIRVNKTFSVMIKPFCFLGVTAKNRSSCTSVLRKQVSYHFAEFLP